MPENNAKNTMQNVSTKTIAQLLKLTPERVQQLSKDGVIPYTKVKGDYQFNFVLAIQSYIEYLRDIAENKAHKASNAELERERLEADARLKSAKADKAELEAKELKGQMHRSEDVEAVITDLIMFIRGALIALPGQLAVDMANITTAPHAQNRLQEAAYEILEQLTRYEYNPEVYAERVRERKGWESAPQIDEIVEEIINRT